MPAGGSGAVSDALGGSCCTGAAVVPSLCGVTCAIEGKSRQRAKRNKKIKSKQTNDCLHIKISSICPRSKSFTACACMHQFGWFRRHCTIDSASMLRRKTGTCCPRSTLYHAYCPCRIYRVLQSSRTYVTTPTGPTSLASASITMTAPRQEQRLASVRKYTAAMTQDTDSSVICSGVSHKRLILRSCRSLRLGFTQ